MAKPKLTEKDFQNAAKKLRCDVPAIKAVAEVESRGAGFYEDGFPVILFERHKFREFTKGKYSKTHPRLSGPAGGYGPAGQNQRNKFNEAFELDPEAAMKSCSWGKFQLMGFNHKLCGFQTVGEFVDAMKESEGKQLDGFVSFVISCGLADELRRHDWAGFARGYNGAAYKKNNYDSKMAAAHKKFSKLGAPSVPAEPQNFEKSPEILPEAPAEIAPNINEGEGNPPDISNKAIESSVTRETSETGEEKTTATAQKVNEQDVNQTEAIKEPAPYNEIGFFATIKRDLTWILGGNVTVQTLTEYGQQAQTVVPSSLLTKLAYLIAAISVLYLIFRGVHYAVDSWKKNQKAKLEAEINTDVSRKNMEWK